MDGKVVVFTGTLQEKRAIAKKMAENAGATVAASVSGKTDILIVGADAGSKVAAAEAKGVVIWDEAQFVAACKGPASVPAPAPTGKKGAAPAPVAAAPAPVAQGKRKADDQPLVGMAFVRTGSFQYNKAVGDFVTALGGTWVKKAKDATAAVNGRAEVMHTVNWSKNIEELVAMQKPIVVLEMDFTGGKGAAPTASMVQTFLDALDAAKALASTHCTAGKSASDITLAFRQAFAHISYTYPSSAAETWAECESPENLRGSVLVQGPKGLKWSAPVA